MIKMWLIIIMVGVDGGRIKLNNEDVGILKGKNLQAHGQIYVCLIVAVRSDQSGSFVRLLENSELANPRSKAVQTHTFLELVRVAEGSKIHLNQTSEIFSCLMAIQYRSSTVPSLLVT